VVGRPRTGGPGAWVSRSCGSEGGNGMTEQKARKRQVRTRMAKTGERYTSARRNVTKPEPPASSCRRAAVLRVGRPQGDGQGLGRLVPDPRQLGRNGPHAHRDRPARRDGPRRRRMVGPKRDGRLRAGSRDARRASAPGRLHGGRQQDVPGRGGARPPRAFTGAPAQPLARARDAQAPNRDRPNVRSVRLQRRLVPRGGVRHGEGS
jgi:hypothetical protein